MYRSVDKTAMSIERYSKKDARTWKKLFDNCLALQSIKCVKYCQLWMSAL